MFVVGLAGLTACAPGEEPAPVCEGGGERAVQVGHTGLDFEAIAEGDALPSWQRPQGGIGTRLNVLLEGFSEDALFAALTAQIFGVEEGEACEERADCGDLETCDGGLCRVLLVDQTYASFARECVEGGALHVSELPFQFRNAFELSALDGVEHELRVTVEPREGAPLTTSVRVVIEVGDFIEPSWWGTAEF